MWFDLCVDKTEDYERVTSHCLDDGTSNRGEAYGESDGTSFATPLVAGVAALLMARAPNLTPQDIKEILQLTASPVPPFDSLVASPNMLSSIVVLNAKKALEMAIKGGGGK
jgi:subtilisin family serine protease